jgi:GT2 family glycosyltransferase
LEPDCLANLVEAFKELKSNKVRVGAVAPRLITDRPEIDDLLKGKLSFVRGVFFYESYTKRKIMKRNRVPSMLNKWTGLTYDNFDIDLDSIKETVKIHACSLFLKNVFKEVGGYSNVYGGRYAPLEETDMIFRIANRGYKLYFQPKAVAYHKRTSMGGCADLLTPTGYYHILRNQFLFLVRNFGWKSLYMLPFLLFFIIFNVIRYGIVRLFSYFYSIW